MPAGGQQLVEFIQSQGKAGTPENAGASAAEVGQGKFSPLFTQAAASTTGTPASTTTATPAPITPETVAANTPSNIGEGFTPPTPNIASTTAPKITTGGTATGAAPSGVPSVGGDVTNQPSQGVTTPVKPEEVISSSLGSLF